MSETRERRLVFGQDAAGYDDSRPSYPAPLIDDLVELVGQDAKVIEVGTGTAKASRLLAERGMTGVGVEPDPDMAAVARTHLAPYPGWRVDVSDFEWWRPESGDAPADLVASAQAWHWVHPQVGAWRAHRLLRPGGWIAVWWNLAEEEPTPVRRAIEAVFAELCPGEIFVPVIDPRESSPFVAAPGDATFADATTRLYRWTVTYTTARLLDLLRSHSSVKLLAADRRERLLTAVAGAVDGHGGTFDYPYVTRLWIARRP